MSLDLIGEIVDRKVFSLDDHLDYGSMSIRMENPVVGVHITVLNTGKYEVRVSLPWGTSYRLHEYATLSDAQAVMPTYEMMMTSGVTISIDGPTATTFKK